MQNARAMLRKLVLSIALIFGVALSGAPAFAVDKVYLKDGRVLEGTIVREESGYVWFNAKVGAIQQELFFGPADIEKVERDAAAPANAAAAGKPDPSKARPAERRAGVPRIAIMTMGDTHDGKDMVGMYMTAGSIRRAIPTLEQEGVTDLVLLFNSGGGALLEIQRLSDLIEYELKPKFRVVGWIRWAISAAAMTCHAIPEVYFMPQGTYGACTGWYGQLQAVKGRELEEVLFMMEKISARGGYSPEIMRSMQILEPLSCNIDANGDVTWYQDETGQILVNPKDRILTFTAELAAKVKFSKGTAATHEELARLMGYTEVEWVGEKKPGIAYPVSRAEEEVIGFRDQTKNDLDRTNEYFISYQTAKATAASLQDRKDRAKFVSRATSYLDKIEKMVRNNENLALFVFGVLPETFWNEWLPQQRKELKDLLK